MSSDEYVWDIALSTRLDPAFEGEVAVGTREGVILNIHRATNHAYNERDMIPVGDVANMIINIWWHMKAADERHAQEA